MRKIIFASHHRFADGLKDTFDYIAPNVADVTAISAYVDNVPVAEAIKKALTGLDLSKDEVLVFTDLLGGSVNQAFTKYVSNPHFHVISGMNLPVVMSIILALPKDDYVDENFLRNCLEDARQQLVYVNDKFLQTELDEEDE